jgi:hypothetical protein
MLARWERCDDGIIWRPWMDIHFTPIEDTPAASSDVLSHSERNNQGPAA